MIEKMSAKNKVAILLFSVTLISAQTVSAQNDRGGLAKRPTIVENNSLLSVEIDLTSDPDGAGRISMYQWQRCSSACNVSTNWASIAGATNEIYPIPCADDSAYFRAQITYTDARDNTRTVASSSTQVALIPFVEGSGNSWSEFAGGAKNVCDNSTINNSNDDDVDNDDDGLIELCYLEDVDAVRYNLNGSGYKASATTATVTRGCPNNICKGYELVRDLDFTDNDSYRNSTANKPQWTAGKGWLPIGSTATGLNGIFEGNGHTLSHLRISRSTADYVSLFASLSDSAHINGLGVINASVRGKNYVGGLAAQSNGKISNSYSSGTINGAENVGGLVGINSSSATIANSYNAARISGGNAGGLVGQNAGNIANSYNTGFISGATGIGGLVGVENGGTITNSYGRGSVRTPFRGSIGALVGRDQGKNSLVMDSYSSISTVFVLVGRRVNIRTINSAVKTAAELQGPTASTGIYSAWSEDDWYFGTSTDYPILKYTSGTHVNYPACGQSQQPICNATLDGQGVDLLTLADAACVRVRAKESEVVTLNPARVGNISVESYTGSERLVLPKADTSVLRFLMPPDVEVINGAPTGTLTLRLKVGTAMQTIEIITDTIPNGIMNRPQTRRSNVDTLVIEEDLASDPDGAGTTSSISYQWEQCGNCNAHNRWEAIPGATGRAYQIANPDRATIAKTHFRAQLTYTDAQGYKGMVTSIPFPYKKGIRVRVKVILEGALE